MGNQFQNASLNQFNESTVKKLDFSEEQKQNSLKLQNELEDLQKQNEDILASIIQQKKRNAWNMKNVDEGKDYQLFEDTVQGDTANKFNQPSNYMSDDDYEEDEFEVQSPKQVVKPDLNNAQRHYDDLEESDILRQKQEENDPLAEFYQQQSPNQYQNDDEDSPSKKSRKAWGIEKQTPPQTGKGVLFDET